MITALGNIINYKEKPRRAFHHIRVIKELGSGYSIYTTNYEIAYLDTTQTSYEI